MVWSSSQRQGRVDRHLQLDLRLATSELPVWEWHGRILYGRLRQHCRYGQIVQRKLRRPLFHEQVDWGRHRRQRGNLQPLCHPASRFLYDPVHQRQQHPQDLPQRHCYEMPHHLHRNRHPRRMAQQFRASLPPFLSLHLNQLHLRRLRFCIMS